MEAKKSNVIITNQVEEEFNAAFSKQRLDMYGTSSEQPPTWIRPKTLNKVRLKNFIHVVGHTYQEKGVNNKHYKNIILCDALPKQYLVIEPNGETKAVNI